MSINHRAPNQNPRLRIFVRPTHYVYLDIITIVFKYFKFSRKCIICFVQECIILPFNLLAEHRFHVIFSKIIYKCMYALTETSYNEWTIYSSVIYLNFIFIWLDDGNTILTFESVHYFWHCKLLKYISSKKYISSQKHHTLSRHVLHVWKS